MQPLPWTQALNRAPHSWMCNIVWGGNQLALESFTMPGLEGCLLSVPCADSEAGGDIYHVTVCNQGVFSKFLLVDVVGHGASAARISARLQQPLARLMSELDNSAILAELNQKILNSEPDGHFATAAAATYNRWDNSWSYAYAGHPYMLIRRHGRWQALPECCAGPPVGILDDIQYFENEVPLAAEDWLFVFSDAVVEIRQHDGGTLGFAGLVEIMDRIQSDSVDDFYQALVDKLIAVNGGPHFNDDLTLILLKHRHAQEKFSARALSGVHRLMMRWMKRHESPCNTRLDDPPSALKM